MTAFEEFGVIPELGKAVEDMDWLLPTDVQAEAIPLILGGIYFIFFLTNLYFTISEITKQEVTY